MRPVRPESQHTFCGTGRDEGILKPHARLPWAPSVSSRGPQPRGSGATRTGCGIHPGTNQALHPSDCAGPQSPAQRSQVGALQPARAADSRHWPRRGRHAHISQLLLPIQPVKEPWIARFYGECVVTLRWVSRRGVDSSSASQHRLEDSRSCCCGEGGCGCTSRPRSSRSFMIGSRSARARRACSGPRPRRSRKTSSPGQ